jgi:outer membrane lipoprotein SlyB
MDAENAPRFPVDRRAAPAPQRRPPDRAPRADERNGVGGIGASAAGAVAARGIADGTSRFDAAARRIVAAGPEVESAVDMKQAQTQVSACVAAARVADEMTGTLIDAFA